MCICDVTVFRQNIWAGYQDLLGYLSLKCLLSPWQTTISSPITHSLISITANMKGIWISSVFAIWTMMVQRTVAVNNPNRMDAHSSHISSASVANATSNRFTTLHVSLHPLDLLLQDSTASSIYQFCHLTQTWGPFFSSKIFSIV